MLNRFRDFVNRLELPQEDDVVYRIIDDNSNAVEVTQAQYAMWRMQHDVTKRAVVGEDTVENVMVRTTFSIMPEHRGYKPFGTSAFEIAFFDPLMQYSQRYDTWQEAERGHRNTLERIRRESATARVVDERAESLAGTAGAVRLAVSAGLPALFQVHVHSEEEVTMHTPLRRIDGSQVDVSVAVAGNAFRLSGTIGRSTQGATEVLEMLEVKVEDSSVSCDVRGEDDLPQGILRVAQAVACLSAMSNDLN